MHAPFKSLAGFDSEELMNEGHIAILPARHPLAARRTLSLADENDIADLPLARWPRHGTYPPGPGSEIHDQTQLAQMIALGRTVAVFPVRPRLAVGRAHRRPRDRRAGRRHPHRLARAQPLPGPRRADPTARSYDPLLPSLDGVRAPAFFPGQAATATRLPSALKSTSSWAS